LIATLLAVRYTEAMAAEDDELLEGVVVDGTNADRQRRWRERQAGRLPAPAKPICPACGITHTGARGMFCSRCWERLTPEGRQFKADRVARSRALKRHGLSTGPVVTD
jgi:hypothetical protein